MADWVLSSEKMTVRITTDRSGVITEAAPIVRRFIGQHASNLAEWMRRQGGYWQERLAEVAR